MDYKQHKGNLRGQIKNQVERKLYNKRIRSEAIDVDMSEGINNKTMKTGIELIAQERAEQIEKHGRTIESDIATNRGYQLTEAAAVLSTEKVRSSKQRFSLMPEDWDDEICFKMCKKGRKERLITAGALIAAELDKIQSL